MKDKICTLCGKKDCPCPPMESFAKLGRKPKTDWTTILINAGLWGSAVLIGIVVWWSSR